MKTPVLALFLMLILSTSISALQVSVSDVRTGERSATITWTTDNNARGVVEYGTDALLLSQRDDSALARASRSQTVTLQSLLPNTQYYFKITAIDEVTVEPASSETSSFRTSVSSDLRAPLVLNLAASQFSADSTTLSWSTNEQATAILHTGTEKISVPLGLDHTATVQTVPDSVVDATVEACDSSNNCANYSITFLAGIPTGPPNLSMSIPTLVRTSSITLLGVTRPFSEVSVFVNDLKQRQVRAGRNGTVIIPDIVLINDSVIIRVESVDTLGNKATVSNTVRIDARPPILTLSELPTIGKSTTVTINGTVTKPVTLKILVNQTEVKTAAVPAGTFNIDITLTEGNHQISVLATDEAGNKAEKKLSTRVDNLVPQISNHNLGTISPTYIPEVTVRGSVSEPATVLVFAKMRSQRNYPQDPIAIGRTDGEGRFSIDVRLPPEIRVVDEPDAVEVGFQGETVTSASLSNPSASAGLTAKGEARYEIKIEALDDAGHKSQARTGQITYTQCSDSGPFEVEYGDISPDILIPSMILQGSQSIGIPVNITYNGLQDFRFRQRPRAELFSPGRDSRDEYDNDWISGVIPTFPSHTKGKKSWTGYITLQFRKQLNDDSKLQELQEDVSRHRENECYPGFGCAKLVLMLEIEGQELVPKLFEDPRIQDTTGDVDAKPIFQRSCLDVTKMIDNSELLGEHIPSAFLEASAEVIDTAVDVIDKVLKPLTQITTYVMYGCLLSQGHHFIQLAFEKYNCEFATVTSGSAADLFRAVAGKKSEIIDVASINKCEEVYGETGTAGGNEDEKREKLRMCNQCRKAKQDTYDARQIYRRVCDRVACPSAPTLQTYIRDKQKEGVEKVAPTAAGVAAAARARESPTGIGAALGPGFAKEDLAASYYKGSSCGFPDTQTGYDAVKEIYEKYLVNKAPPTGDAKAKCTGLHAASPECCGVEYMEQWNSACGDEYLDGTPLNFDEIKESVCLGAQKANLRNFTYTDGTETKDFDCGGFVNMAAGLCDQDNLPSPQLINTGMDIPSKYGPYASDPHLHIVIKTSKGNDKYLYDIAAGYIGKHSVIAKDELERPKLESGDDFIIETNTISGVRKLIDLNTFFSQQNIDRYRANPKGLGASYDAELKKLLATTGSTGAGKQDLFKNVVDRIGVSDKTYIVKPDQEGILRATQCVCLPAIAAYLNQWRAILSATGNCVNALRLNGKGSAGICEDFLSVQLCDMVYDAISCFAKESSFSGAGTTLEGETGIGDVLGALTSAGTEMQQEIQGRYGGSEMWKGVYGERQLAHSICRFAFTGDWDFNVEALVQSSIDRTPIQSQATITSASRRFVRFDPVTKPSGLVTWVYHFALGLVAGSDLNYRVELQCSNDASCEASDGFVDGKCDCFGDSQPTRKTIKSGSLRRNQILNEAFDQVMQSEKVRYDKVFLTWTYRDPKTNSFVTESEELTALPTTGGKEKNPVFRNIVQKGTTPYVYCRFDETLFKSYRCDLNIGEYSGARFASDPRPLYKGEQSAFTLKPDDPLRFDVEVLLSTPSDEKRETCPENQYTKFLIWELRNQNNVVFATNKQGLQASRSGDFISIDTVGTSNHQVPRQEILLKPEFFSLAPGQSSSVPDPAVIASSGGQTPRIISVTPRVVTDPGVNLDFVIILDEDGTTYLYKGSGQYQPPESRPNVIKWTQAQEDAKKNPIPDHITKGQWGFFFKDPSASVAGAKNIVRYDARTRQLNFTIDGRFIQIILDRPATGYTEIRYLQRGLTTGQSLCSGSNPRDKADNFTAVFYLVDSIKSEGSPCYEPNFNQITVDPTTDGEARKEIKFSAICANEVRARETTSNQPHVCSTTNGEVLTGSCFCGTEADLTTALSRIPDRSQRTAAAVHNCDAPKVCYSSAGSSPRCLEFNPATAFTGTVTSPSTPITAGTTVDVEIEVPGLDLTKVIAVYESIPAKKITHVISGTRVKLPGYLANYDLQGKKFLVAYEASDHALTTTAAIEPFKVIPKITSPKLCRSSIEPLTEGCFCGADSDFEAQKLVETNGELLHNCGPNLPFSSQGLNTALCIDSAGKPTCVPQEGSVTIEGSRKGNVYTLKVTQPSTGIEQMYFGTTSPRFRAISRMTKNTDGSFSYTIPAGTSADSTGFAPLVNEGGKRTLLPYKSAKDIAEETTPSSSVPSATASAPPATNINPAYFGTGGFFCKTNYAIQGNFKDLSPEWGKGYEWTFATRELTYMTLASRASLELCVHNDYKDDIFLDITCPTSHEETGEIMNRWTGDWGKTKSNINADNAPLKLCVKKDSKAKVFLAASEEICKQRGAEKWGDFNPSTMEQHVKLFTSANSYGQVSSGWAYLCVNTV